MTSYANNGRVDINNKDLNYQNTKMLFQMYDQIPCDNKCTEYRNPVEGLWDNTDLSKTFFSKENIQIIQNGIRAGVYHKSNSQYIIGEQDCDTLKIIMRSIFLQYSANQMSNVTEQVGQLNNLVLKYAIHQIFNECIGYNKYISDVSTMWKPIDHPVLAKNNDKELVLKPWF